MESNDCQEGDTYDERITITPQPQSSITIMDQKTGQIKAMVGGRGEKLPALVLTEPTRDQKDSQDLHSRFLQLMHRH